MNKLGKETRTRVIRCLVEGNSIRATVRITGAAKNTIVKLLAEIGVACAKYQNKTLRNLTCKQIQCDEIWQFCYAKARNVPADKQGVFGYGDVWTWVAIDADSKLVASYVIGNSGAQSARQLMDDLASRLANRIQLTTDGRRVYVDAAGGAFDSEIDYAILVKLYGNDGASDTRHSPVERIGCQTVGIMGRPNPKRISTSFVERRNLTMRMQMRQFTRLTNAFSKKIENHAWAVSLHVMYYNFCRVHQALRVTPAMAAGVSDHIWNVSEIVDLLGFENEGTAITPVPRNYSASTSNRSQGEKSI